MRKKFILLFLPVLFLPILSGCSKTESYNYAAKKVVVVEAQEKNIENSFLFTGNLEGNKETLVAAKTPGQVKEISVNIGDSVKSGETLARLTGEENFTNRNTAYSNYQNALSGVKNTEYMMDQKVEATKAALSVAKNNLLAIQTADANEDNISLDQINAAEIALEKALIAKESIDKTFEQKERDVLETTMSAINQSVILVRDTISFLYSLNGVGLPDEENDFEINNNFVVKTKENTTKAKIKITMTKKSYYEFENYYNALNKFNYKREEVLEGGKETEEILNEVREALESMNGVIVDSITHANMSQADLDAYRSQVASYRTNVENMLLSQDSGVAIGLKGVNQLFENLGVEKENQLMQIEKDIEMAKRQLDLINNNIKAGKDELSTKTEIAESQVLQAEKALNMAEGQMAVQIQTAKTQADLSRGALNMANVEVGNTFLRAPYDGVVVEKLAEEGAVINAGTPILKVADVSKLKLVIFVPESQIKYLKKGTKGMATSDSFSSEEFEAVIERISPKTEEGSKKIRVELSIEKVDYLKIGMNMNLEIKQEMTRKTVMIPDNSIVRKNNINTVYAVNEGKIKIKEVETGIVSEEEIEIVSGVEVGEKIAVKGFDGLREMDEVEIIE